MPSWWSQEYSWFNHNILTLATHSSSPLVPVWIISTNKGHHPSSNHTPFPDIPTLYPCLFYHMIISCSHLQYLPHGCPIHSPHVLTLIHANYVKTLHSIIIPSSILTFHLKLTIIHMVLTHSIHLTPYTSRSFIQSLSYYCFQSYHLILTYHHLHGPTLFPTSTHLAISSSTANQPSGPSPAQSAPSRLKCFWL